MDPAVSKRSGAYHLAASVDLRSRQLNHSISSGSVSANRSEWQTMRISPATTSTRKSEFHLSFEARRPEAEVSGGLTSFNASLNSFDKSDVDLAGLSGLLIDLEKVEAGPLCITIHEALTRHTPPKRLTALSGSEACLDLEGGTDGRMSKVDTRHAMFLWLPEIFDEGARGGGTRLLQALRAFLSLDVTVLVDFGVEGEQRGFIDIFYPRLRSLGLRLSKTGQFAKGKWRKGPAGRIPLREIGFVHL